MNSRQRGKSPASPHGLHNTSGWACAETEPSARSVHKMPPKLAPNTFPKLAPDPDVQASKTKKQRG